MDVTQKYIHWYNNITRLYITRPGAAVGHLRSNNAKLRDVADDPQQVLDICNNNERYIEEIHNMYDLPIVPPPVHRGRVRVEEAELDEVYHNVLMTMMPTFGAGYCDSKFGTGYYDAGVGPSTSYMHGHGRDYGEHNKYLYHEASADVSDRQEYQQEPENQEDREPHIVQSRRRRPARNRRRSGCEHIDFLLSIK
uniref:Uncharacterized protein n=1 Tax=Cucumis melo TaxID=3656 RepID=A0A9I9ELB8_CUCME